jgi:hypothetical protein
VVFVDLSDSTQLKSEVPPDEWLGYVFEFIQTIARHAEAEGGSVVKRIGDEVMVTFADPTRCEAFVDRLITDELMQRYRFKVAADAGEAFHFQFVVGLNLDPYGQVVDRCSRIAKLAAAGVVLCSEAYRKRLDNPSDYVELGEFSLKGFQKPETVFWRPLLAESDASFIEPLLAAVNDRSAEFAGYRVMSRVVTRDELRKLPGGYRAARPFLIRELVNLPKLPIGPKQLSEIIRSSKDPDVRSQYLGYLVEWSGVFRQFKRNQDGIDLDVTLPEITGTIWDEATLRLPLFYLEIVRSLKDQDRIFFRGVITGLSLGYQLNYVELLRVEHGAA